MTNLYSASRQWAERPADDLVSKYAVKKGLSVLNKAVVLEAYETADRSDTAGNPRTVYGMVNGLTEASQLNRFGENRTAIDQAAGKVLSMAF